MRGIENYMKAYLKAFSFVFLYIFIGAILVNIFKINAVVATTISNVFMILLYYILKYFDKEESLNKKEFDFKDEAIYFFIGWFFIGFTLSQAFSVNLLNNGVGVKEMSDSITKIDPTFYLFFVIAIAPFSEEIIFRGFLFKTLLKNNVSFYIALFIQAISFALIHGAGFKIPATFFLGLLTGLVFYYYKNIYHSIFIHALSNLYIVVSPNNALVLKLSNLNMYFLGIVFTIFIISFFIFSKKIYKKNKPLG